MSSVRRMKSYPSLLEEDSDKGRRKGHGLSTGWGRVMSQGSTLPTENC